MRALAAAALFLAFPALCAAQGDAPIAKPEVKVGDQWTYRRMNYETGKAGPAYEVRVSFADRGVIHVVSTREGKEEETDTTFTSDWNAVSARGRVFYPHNGWFRFPLRVGDTYHAGFEVVIPGKGANAKNERQVKVLGWEEVTVPAGRFRALKLQSEGLFQRLDNTFISGKSRNVIWYVPQIKRWVKLTSENWSNRKGLVEHSGEELVDYKLQ